MAASPALNMVSPANLVNFVMAQTSLIGRASPLSRSGCCFCDVTAAHYPSDSWVSWLDATVAMSSYNESESLIDLLGLQCDNFDERLPWSNRPTTLMTLTITFLVRTTRQLGTGGCRI
jgi:hypothetical protein